MGKVNRRAALVGGVAAGLLGLTAAGLATATREDSSATVKPVVAEGSVLGAPEWTERIGVKYARTHPAWFENIHRSYNYDPRLTPDFDFASLYSAGR
jgi:hypothetical protein